MELLPKTRLVRGLVALAALVPALCSVPEAVQARGRETGVRQEAVSLYSPAQRSARFDACRELFPNSKPIPIESVPSHFIPRGLCSDSFAILYSGLTKTPLVVVERLNRSSLHSASDVNRTDDFFADPRLPRSERAELRDYAGSGYDRGHMSAAANQPSTRSMAQSFSLSNIVPQHPQNNRKVWAKLEADTRKFARRAKGPVFVFSGPLFRDGVTTVGKQKVWVPTHLFKLVHDEAGGRSWAYVIPRSTGDHR